MMVTFTDGPRPARHGMRLMPSQPNLYKVPTPPPTLSEEVAESLYGLMLTDMELVKSGVLRPETPSIAARLQERIRRDLGRGRYRR